jgi:hypothetical protein
MEADILDGKIGNVGAYDLEFKGGKLSFKIGASTDVGSVDVVVSVGAHQVLEAIKKAIPGEIDNTIIDILKKAILGA